MKLGGPLTPLVSEVLLKRFEQPDEVRDMTLGRFEVVRLGGMTIGRTICLPGWRWSDRVLRAAASASCAPGIFSTSRPSLTTHGSSVISSTYRCTF